MQTRHISFHIHKSYITDIIALCISDHRCMVHNIISSCTLLRCQIVLSFTLHCTHDIVPSFTAGLWQSIQAHIRGYSYTTSCNRHGYKSNMTSRRNAASLRIYTELLNIQLSLLRNFELDDTYTNNDC